MAMILEYKQPNLFYVGTRLFMPGVNEVSVEEWKVLSENRLFMAKFDRGELRWLDGGPKSAASKPGSAEASLKKLKQDDAKKLVGKTLDLVLLEKWHSEENRPAVRMAIAKQIEDLIPDEAKTSEKGEGKDEK